MIKIPTRIYLEIYLEWLKDEKTVAELALRYKVSESSVRKYIEYGRNLAIVKYNKHFINAARLSDSKRKNRVFDTDLKQFLYNF